MRAWCSGGSAWRPPRRGERRDLADDRGQNGDDRGLGQQQRDPVGHRLERHPDGAEAVLRGDRECGHHHHDHQAELVAALGLADRDVGVGPDVRGDQRREPDGQDEGQQHGPPRRPGGEQLDALGGDQCHRAHFPTTVRSAADADWYSTASPVRRMNACSSEPVCGLSSCSTTRRRRRCRRPGRCWPRRPSARCR